MFGKLASIALAAASLCAAQLVSTATASPLPVVFFHGVTGDHTNAAVIEANLTGEGRAYVALDFCEKACSVKTSLVEQIQMAIKQIRSIVSSDTRYANGYHFMGHSTGASIARGVIEEMDDHKVHSLISLAGDGNGGFWGPQASDQVGLQVLLQLLGPYAISASDFNFTKYAVDPATWNGKVQRDLAEFASTRPDLQRSNSIVQNVRVPVAGLNAGWIANGTFYPQVNNLEMCHGNASCSLNQERRKCNFLKLQAAHFFASPQDDLQTPWQTSLLGRYSEVDTIDEVETKFAELTIVDMKQTREYEQDLYGLKTLDKAGRLHLHSIPNVGHDCWLFDYTPLNSNVTCLHDPVYATNIYPLLI